ncbi:MAG: hypothetical protein FJY99_12955 [Candidatus Sericytochromatia bacterium]|nr:hypothetical protein [Candidatus Tanganyikabacteria bacterium]
MNARFGSLVATLPVLATLLLVACQQAQAPTATTTVSPVATLSPDDLGETVELGTDAEELALLGRTLGADATLEDLAGLTPLINDGGAVFLDQAASAFRTASLGVLGRPYDRDFDDIPRLRVLPMVRKATGKADAVALSCAQDAADPGEVRRRSICLDRGRRTAAVVSVERLEGRLAIDLPPYSPGRFSDVGEGEFGEGVGLPVRSGRAETRIEFVRRRTGWDVLSVSSTRFVSDALPTTAPRISWIDGVYGEMRRVPEHERFDKLIRRDRFPGMPPNSQVLLRVKMSAPAPTLVMAAGLRPAPIRLVDDGTRGDDIPRDGLYSARVPTPRQPQRSFRLTVTAVPASFLATESVSAVPEETWIVPFTVQ